MSYRIRSQFPLQRLAPVTVGISILGCANATQLGTERPVTASYASMSMGRAANARSVVTSTLSLALDRIDQRDLPLDRTYRRVGTGRGVTVYVFDGGVLAGHPELAGRVRKGYDGFPNDPGVCNAHGTAVAGAAAGKTLGVAPDAEVVDVKMVECNKLRGTVKAIVEGTDWVIEDHARTRRPAVANWSFIADTASHIPALDSAVARLRAAGIPVIVSAGNVELNACRVSPGNADGATVVGASSIVRDENARSAEGVKLVDRRAPNTAFGPCIDFYAPGDSVLLPSFDASQTPTVQLWNGTSMSAGYVSGSVALYLESHPRALPDEPIRYLRANATMNIVRDSHSPITWLLYVGPVREELKSVAEIRAAMLQRP